MRENEKMVEAYRRLFEKKYISKEKLPSPSPTIPVSTLSPAGPFFKRRFSIKGFSSEDVKKYQCDKSFISQSENNSALKE